MNEKIVSLTNLLWVLGVLAVGVWMYALGALSVMVAPTNTLEELHQGYNHIRVYEDGSYIGQTTGGLPVSGCIKGGLCED